MKRFTVVFAIALLLVALGAIPVFAQSSGSFAYGAGNTDVGCVLLSNGSFSGGVQCIVTSVGCGLSATACAPGGAGNTACAGSIGAGSVCLPSTACGGAGCCSVAACSDNLFACGNNNDCTKIYGSNSGATCSGGFCVLPATNLPGDCVGNASAALKTNSGSGNVFDVRIAAVVGLITDVTVSSKQTQPAVSTALAGIDFTLSVVPDNPSVPAPTMTPGGTVTFDARFVQVSTNLFAGLSANCTSAQGGCFITFAESTVSAHSFDWIIGQPGPKSAGSLQSGEYHINASWAPSVGFGVSGIGEAAACVGPVIMTAQQNKIFRFNEINQF